MRRLIVAAAALVLASCAQPAPPPAPAPAAPPTAAALVDHEGDSPETAVHVPADAPNEGIDFENNWMYDRYGRFRRRSWGIANSGEGSAQRKYKVITIELADHTERTVYFDITENWAAWRPSSK
jgi:hypothetical protein